MHRTVLGQDVWTADHEDEGPIVHAPCRGKFATVESFNLHVGACPVLLRLVDRGIKKAGLTCGCEPAWRCERHAKLARQGRPDRQSEAVVNLVYDPEFRPGFEGMGTDTGSSETGTQNPGLGRDGRRVSARQPAPTGRPRKYRNESERRRARAAQERARYRRG